MRKRGIGKKVAALGMVLLLGLTAACVPAAEEITPTILPAGMGIIEIRVTDPPPADVTSAVVTLANIEVQREGGGWETIDLGGEVTFDLMEVLDVTGVLGSANVTAGSFTQIRMDVSEVEVEFVTDSTTAPVTTDTVIAEVPSQKLRIVKAFEVVDGMKTVLTLDFDGEKSLILPGKDIDTGKERALFKPVVKLLIEHEEGEEEEEEARKRGRP